MAYVKTWSTKEEVLKDLARASGRTIRKKDNLDEGYLVIGDAPPPVIAEDEDAEMKILFGEAISRKSIPTEEDATPDLAGIQQMLRMMQDFNSGNDDDTTDPANSKDCVIALTKVSKLNPNVKEFKPNDFISPSTTNNDNKNINSPSKSNIINQDINSSVVAQSVDVNKDVSTKETEVSTKNKDLDLNVNAKENEDQDFVTTLKNQISEGSKSDSFELKKQKNVAIATLLRLYATKETPPKNNTAPLKLITPEYFEAKVESDPNVKVEAPVDIVTNQPTASKAKDSPSTLPSGSTYSTSTSSPPSETSPKIKIDPEIKKSIDKVKRWLDEPTKRKSPAVCLGPIAFKRKEPNSCKSPISDTAPKAPKPSSDSQQYRPSKYAEDLGRQYLERSKAIESKKKELTWVNLEEVLKEKDLIIKKRLQEQATAASSDS